MSGGNEPGQRAWSLLDREAFGREVVEAANKPLPRSVWWTLLTVAIIPLAAIVWAALADLDRVVTVDGRLVSAKPRQVVQPLAAVRLRGIEKRAGEAVRAGEVLVTFDTDLARVEVEDLKGRLVTLEAERARLALESAPDGPILGDPSASPASLEIADSERPGVRAQAGLYTVRRDEMVARAASDARRVATLEEASKAAAERETLLEAQVETAGAAVARQEKLRKGETGTQSAVDTATAQRRGAEVDLLRTRDELRANAAQIGAIENERRVFLAARLGEVATRLAEVERGIEEVRGRLARQLYVAELDTAVARFDGVVLEASDRAPGSSVAPGETLMVVLPTLADGDMEIEAALPPGDVGWVREGLPVRFKLEALPFNRHGYVEGEVRAVSADEVAAAPPTGATPFRASTPRSVGHRVVARVMRNGLHDLPPGFSLTPGMAGRVEIVLGRRSVAAYLLDPFIEGMDGALKEPN